MENINPNDNYLLSKALKYYDRWEHKYTTKKKHLSLIFAGSHLFSRGENKDKSHTLFKIMERVLPDKYYTIHSEIAAILNLMRLLRTKNFDNFPKDLTMVNFRSNLRMAAPCGNCLIILKLLNFKEIYFSISENNFGYINLQNVEV